MTWILANCLQLVISDLISPEQNYAVKGRLIQNNLHLVNKALEGIKDGTEAALINLNQSKAFDRVDHLFLATILETAEFRTEFCKWISMIYHNPLAVVQVSGKRSEAFVIKQSVLQGCPYLHFSMSLLWRLRDEGANPALRGFPFASRLTAYANDITVFVSRRLDIKTVKKAVKTDIRSQDQLWWERRSEVGCLERWHSPARTFPLRMSSPVLDSRRGSGRPASNPSSSYCSTVVTS